MDDDKIALANAATLLETLVEDEALMEIGRKAVEDCLIEMRDDRMFTIRNNGLVVCERDGKVSSVIRLGPEHGVAIALKAIAKKMREG